MTEEAVSSKKKLFDSRYEVLGVVGRGASSVVYRAKHTLANDKEVAIKVITKSPSKDLADLLRHEALAMITARHKYIVRLEDFRSIDSICYLAMEYMPLSDLRTFTKNTDHKLNPFQAERFFRQITEALAFMHGIGMLHRDIKPENILILNERQARLSDFGVATLPGQTPSLDELKQGVGTLDYMAPEVFAAKDFTPASDIYSLCLTFYELLTGTHPFQDLPMAQALLARQKTEIESLEKLVPKCPTYISKAVMRGISFEAEKRFKNAEDLLTFLNDEVAKASDLNTSSSSISASIHTGNTAQAFIAEAPTDLQVPPEPVEAKTTEPQATTTAEDFEKDSDDNFHTPENPPTTAKLAEFEHSPNEEPRESFLSRLIFASMIILALTIAYKFVVAPLLSSEESLAGNAIENSFPVLENGVYSGSISGGFSASPTPLTVLSMEDGQKITILLGLEGWQPVSLDLANSVKEDGLHFSSNGFDLILKVDHSNALFSGEVENLTLKTTGQWSLQKPA